MPYAPATESDVHRMLAKIGVSSIDDLFADIPSQLQFSGHLDLPTGIGESELVGELTRLAGRNVDATREVSFLGYGSYDHFIPAVCGAITSRSEYSTSYTPYQPEVSQGTLQAIFEFQTAISEITGLPVANASLYDGATAAAEAMYVSEQITKRATAVVLGSVHDHVRGVLQTYARAYGMQLITVPYDETSGITPLESLERVLDDTVACVIVQQPSAFGTLEDAPAICAAARAAGAVPVVHCHPLSLGLLEAPGQYGAAICVGDGQPLGNAAAYGGPGFGFFAAEERFLRRLPGRIVGATVDTDGAPGYVLTLQTREQHIRREKATSNICTNQALNALAGVIYLSWLGPRGLRDVGTLMMDRIQQVTRQLTGIPGVRTRFSAPVFGEIVLELPIPAADAITACKRRGVHPGYALGAAFPELGDHALLVSATEQRTSADVELLEQALAAAVEELA